MKVTDFQVLTFDCYGTLIDWETGIIQALRPWLTRNSKNISDDEILSVFALYESHHQQENPKNLYPEILAKVYKSLAKHWNIAAIIADEHAFADSVKDWPPFPDTVKSLQYLKKYYKLVILSNIDKQSFSASNKKLEVEFDAIYTAEEIGTYKPDINNFKYMLSKLSMLGIKKADILHTAQSLYHDHVPASHLGLATCWINRRYNKAGSGATPNPSENIKTTFTVNSLEDFVNLHKTSLA